MKKLLAAFVLAASISACHYGTEEAQKTLETNELYKGDRAGYSVNRANVNPGEAAAPATADSTSKDTATAVK